eukprot:359237-Chlamydomonas_euryale.AAC.4
MLCGSWGRRAQAGRPQRAPAQSVGGNGGMSGGRREGVRERGGQGVPQSRARTTKDACQRHLACTITNIRPNAGRVVCGCDPGTPRSTYIHLCDWLLLGTPAHTSTTTPSKCLNSATPQPRTSAPAFVSVIDSHPARPSQSTSASVQVGYPIAAPPLHTHRRLCCWLVARRGRLAHVPERAQPAESPRRRRRRQVHARRCRHRAHRRRNHASAAVLVGRAAVGRLPPAAHRHQLRHALGQRLAAAAARLAPAVGAFPAERLAAGGGGMGAEQKLHALERVLEAAPAVGVEHGGQHAAHSGGGSAPAPASVSPPCSAARAPSAVVSAPLAAAPAPPAVLSPSVWTLKAMQCVSGSGGAASDMSSSQSALAKWTSLHRRGSSLGFRSRIRLNGGARVRGALRSCRRQVAPRKGGVEGRCGREVWKGGMEGRRGREAWKGGVEG